MRVLRAAAVASVTVLVLSTPAQAQKFDFQNTMTAGEVVPGPGDPDGAGNFTVSIDNATNEMCYAITFQNTDAPNAAHVHVGSPGKAGRIMVDLNLPANGPNACIPVDSTSVGHMTGGPRSHYLDLHTASHPDGALRGQLQR